MRSPTQRPALSPEMAGAIAKAKDAAGYEAIVQETMVKEDCTYEEAVQRYNQYLFDPDGYSIIKMNEQIRDAGFNSYEEYFIAEKGQEAWDKRQADREADKQQKQNTERQHVVSASRALATRRICSARYRRELACLVQDRGRHFLVLRRNARREPAVRLARWVRAVRAAGARIRRWRAGLNGQGTRGSRTGRPTRTC